jgi:hypothetical protein
LGGAARGGGARFAVHVDSPVAFYTGSICERREWRVNLSEGELKMNKLGIMSTLFGGVLLASPVLAQNIHWTAKEKQVILRGELCQDIENPAEQARGQAEIGANTDALIDNIAANYGMSRAEVGRVGEHEIRSAQVGLWSPQDCPSYEQQAKVLLKKAARQELNQDQQ